MLQVTLDSQPSNVSGAEWTYVGLLQSIAGSFVGSNSIATERVNDLCSQASEDCPEVLPRPVLSGVCKEGGTWPIEEELDMDEPSSSDKSEDKVPFASCQAPLREKPVYGGFYPWIGVKYELNVTTSFSPLQLLNKFTHAFLLPGVMVLDSDGGFRRPGDLESLFPIGGIDLRWRWDPVNHHIVIDFLTTDGEVLNWRWDECIPSKDLRWPSLVPDWTCIGHVGITSFEYSLTAVSDLIPPYLAGSLLDGGDIQTPQNKAMIQDDLPEHLQEDHICEDLRTPIVYLLPDHGKNEDLLGGCPPTRVTRKGNKGRRTRVRTRDFLLEKIPKDKQASS